MTQFTKEIADMIAMLEHENRLVRARNERLQEELDTLQRKFDARNRIWQGLDDTGESD